MSPLRPGDDLASMAADMDHVSVPGVDRLHWALLPPGLPALATRVETLEEHLRLALTEIRLLGEEASWMMRDAEGALDLALDLLAEDQIGAALEATPLS
jgi:hypothetical protein